MIATNKRSKNFYNLRICWALFLTILISTLLIAMPQSISNVNAASENIEITASFSGNEINPNEQIILTLSRELKPDEGRFAILVDSTDVTSLFTKDVNTLTYTPKLFPLPIGESKLVVHVVTPQDVWETLSEFSLRVKADETAKIDTEDPLTEEATDEARESIDSESTEKAGKLSVEFTPNVALNVKGQNQTKTFPEDNAPERNPFTDLAGQGNILFKVSKRGWTLNSQFDFAGSSFIQEALRFGELENKAPKIDLSNYLIELSKDRIKFNLGHVSFGSNRHLLNAFSSRGFTLQVPIGKQNDFTFAAANGSSIVGYNNFLGIKRKKHSLISGTFAREFIATRPGGLRLEFSVLRGSLLPLTNFNQGEINDAEKSLGFGFKVLGSDKKQRLRYELSFTRSKFNNPSDPNLEQDFDVTEIKPETKNAHYAEISFDILQGLSLWKEKKLKLTGTFRHEQIAPLFKSIGTFSQADRRKFQYELTGNFGEMSFGFGNLSSRDNLDNIASILRTLNHQNNFRIGMPLNSFFSPEKPNKWLPTVSYTFGLTHQFGAFLPTAGLFTDESQVPDQKSYNQAFNAQWEISENFGLGYVHSRTFQDNRQIGRVNADLATASNGITATYRPFQTLGLDFDFARERQKSFELNRVDRTFRIGTKGTWQNALFTNSVLSGSFSFTMAGDTGNLSDTRNSELDAQWAYNFSFGEEKFKKVSGQFFVRYANRYGDAIDRENQFNSLNKSQAFNFGLTFNLF